MSVNQVTSYGSCCNFSGLLTKMLIKKTLLAEFVEI